MFIMHIVVVTMGGMMDTPTPPSEFGSGAEIDFDATHTPTAYEKVYCSHNEAFWTCREGSQSGAKMA